MSEGEKQDLKIELYRGESRQLFGQLPLRPIIKESMERILRRSLHLNSIFLLILQVPEEEIPREAPIVENLAADFGYAYVRVYQGNLLIYQHPHPLTDVITQTLRTRLMNQYPEETWWGFRLDVPGIPGLDALPPRISATSAYPAPKVQGDIEVQPYLPGEKPSFSIRRLPDAEPLSKTLTDFGLKVNSPVYLAISWGRGERSGRPLRMETSSHQAPVKIILPETLCQELCEKRPLSNRVEEGGFIIGRVYRDGEEPKTYLLEITDVLAAKYTGASFLHLTFSGDSFVEVKRTLRQSQQGERLLGWYHTHLFPATSEFGLSSIDLELHFSTFTFPWQLAGLINIDNHNHQRTLRFYGREGNKMILCPFWISDRERY